MFESAGLVSGGIAGLALFLTKATGISFGLFFFILNLPFYMFGYFRMGWQFVIKTFIAVTTLSAVVDHLDYVISFDALKPEYAGLVGGLLIGVGMLNLFRHSMSIGGINIMIVYLQDRYEISAGKVQLSFDSAIVILSLLFFDWYVIAISVLSAVMTNIILVMNHVPGRYNPNPKKELVADS